MTESEAREQARGAATGGELTQRLAERIGATAHASAVFGEPVEREGVTVIPVARAMWGFGGGGGGTSGPSGGQGSGGGGGTIVSPLGYIELRSGKAAFRRISYRGLIAGGLAVAIAFAAGIAAAGRR